MRLPHRHIELLAGIAQKSLKEAKYHLRHSGEWILRLGDGTKESHEKVQSALSELWRYTGEFTEDGCEVVLVVIAH